MITKKLTCRTYLKTMDDTVVVARLDRGAENQLVTEVDRDNPLFADWPRHYLVGEIADRLYAYESLGYSPEELKEILKERDRLNAVTKAVGDCKKSMLFDYDTDNVIGHVHKVEPKNDGLRFEVVVGRRQGKTELQRALYKTLVNSLYGVPHDVHLQIENVIFNEPATIVFWKDGTKTVVKATNEEFDPEKGLAMAIAKKALGNKGNYFDKIKKWVKKYKEKHEEELKARAEAKRTFSEFEASFKRLQGTAAAFQWKEED